MYNIKSNKTNNKTVNRFKNNNVKSQLIDYIYSSIDISKFKYEIIETHSDLPKIFSDKFYLTANFIGNNCLLVFTKINDKFYTFTIDRKTLSYSKSRININKINIKYVSVDADIKIYDGTIFDGIYYNYNGIDQFIISDI